MIEMTGEQHLAEADALDARVRELIAAGDVAGLRSIAYPGPCACLGPRDGQPLCPCGMDRATGKQQRRWTAVARHVVPYWLNKDRIVPRAKPA